MTFEGHNELYPALEAALKEATDPLDCNHQENQVVERPPPAGFHAL